MGNIKNSKAFAELEYSIEHYFKFYLAPMMKDAQNELSARQVEEYRAYQDSVSGVLSSGMTYGMPIDQLNVLQIRGEWNSKTTEDYLQMCNERMSGNRAVTQDVLLLCEDWRNLVVEEIGQQRYDELSDRLGGDLAYAYVDHRIQQLMVNKMVEDKIPENSLDYIIQKAGSSSIFGLLSELNKSNLDREIAVQVTNRYQPSSLEKVTGTVLGVAADAVTTGGASSWASLAKFIGVDFALNAVLTKDHQVNEGQSVEECISKGVFGAPSNLFNDFRKEAKQMNEKDNAHLSAINDKLNYKIKIPQFEFSAPFEMRPNCLDNLPKAERDPKYEQVPLVVAPGQEEKFLQEKEERQEREKAEQEQMESAVEERTEPQTVQTSNEYTEPAVSERQNTNGWAGMLSTFGLNGFSDVTKNLGFVLSMLPDMLVGLFTGKSQSLSPMKNLLPLASIVGGLFVKNPILKMLMIGLGGVNLINKAGHEAIHQRNHPDEDVAVAQTGRYKHYEDEPLNPRIQHPLLQGNCLIATIDKVPCSIALPGKVVDAYQQGALPLNTLANAVLARNDQMSQMAQEKYDYANAETQTRTRGIQ